MPSATPIGTSIAGDHHPRALEGDRQFTTGVATAMNDRNRCDD
jgi:hypothetical protein